jgi:hypothetical protein
MLSYCFSTNSCSEPNFFKVIPYMTAAWIAILYAPIPDQMKSSLFHFGSWVFIGLSSLVALFAFFRPRHLIYGESGHRAERRIELGTEKRVYTDDELQKLERSSNPKQIESGKDKE